MHVPRVNTCSNLSKIRFHEKFLLLLTCANATVVSAGYHTTVLASTILPECTQSLKGSSLICAGKYNITWLYNIHYLGRKSQLAPVLSSLPEWVQQQLTVLRTEEPLQCHCLSGLLWSTSFHDEAQNNFPPTHSPVTKTHYFKTSICLVDLTQTQSNFVSARNRRFLKRNYASKQPSPRTGNSG